MNNLIKAELKASEQYKLEPMPKNHKLVNLTPDNVARVEAMVHTDSSYRVSWNTDDVGSSAFAIMQLKKYHETGDLSKKKYKELISKIVERIDSENSTHLNSDGVGREQISSHIIELEYEQLVECLRCPEETDYKLIKKIAKKTKPKDDRHHARRNLSFASKFCHYMCFHLFSGKPEQDNYPIFDSVMRDTLPLYREYYGLKKIKISNTMDYAKYRQAIDEVLDAAEKACGQRISRNGFDHLVWYTNK